MLENFSLVCYNISIPSLFVQCALVQYNRQCTLKPKRSSCRDEVTKKLWVNCCQSPDTGCHRIKIHHTWHRCSLLNFYKCRTMQPDRKKIKHSISCKAVCGKFTLRLQLMASKHKNTKRTPHSKS